jgi:hypothetical protein
MSESFETEAVRLQVVQGKLKMHTTPIGESARYRAPPSWGSLYAACQIIDGGGAEILRDRIEGIAQETYRRTPGGVTNRLRQSVRNINRYLYLRNTVRAKQQRLLAALGCIAIRRRHAYACGAGPHGAFIVSKGRVSDLANLVQRSDLEVYEDSRDDSSLLGWRPALSDPRFSYREVFPGDLTLIIAAADMRVVQQVGDALASIADERDVKLTAQQIARLVGESSDFSALLVRVDSDSVEVREKAVVSDLGSARRVVSSDRTSARSGLAAKASEARSRQRRWTRKGDLRSSEIRTSRDEGKAIGWPGRQLRGGLQRWRSGARQVQRRQGHQFLRQVVELCQLAGGLVLSLILGLWRGVLAVLRSSWRVVGGIWRWTRQHRVFEKLGRACELTLIGVFSGSKGFVSRILPDRQSSATTFSDAARPMARAKVVGFNPSGRSRAAMGAVIMVLAGSGLRINSSRQQAELEALMAQAEEKMLLAEREEVEEERIALLVEAKQIVEQALDVQPNSAQLHELSERLVREWDAATGIVRMRFEGGQVLTIPDGSPRRLAVHGDEFYALDAAGQRLYRWGLDEEGKPGANQEPWILQLRGEADAEAAEGIVDMQWVDAANGRLTPALLMLTTDGAILELDSAGRVRDVSVSDAVRWEGAQAISSYNGSLYVLDPGRENIIKYMPTGDDYDTPPANYFQESVDIEWDKVVDMAIDDSVYLLLSDGSIKKFAGGNAVAFVQEALYPPLEHPVAMFASTDCLSVFVAEPGQARIVEYSRAGEFIGQLRAVGDGENPFGSLGAFGVDPHHRRLFLGTDAGIYSAALPSIQ